MAAGEEDLRKAFCDAEQGHVFRFWDELNADDRKVLLGQLASIEIDQLDRLIETHLAEQKSLPPPSLSPGEVIAIPRSDADREDAARSKQVGEEALRQGQVAVLVVAGGQATRLGYDGPKGTLPITPVTRRSLFSVHAQKTLALQRRYQGRVPFLVLVSPQNHEATRRFFEEKSFFGLDPDQVSFFEQGMLPAIDGDGRLLLAERGRIFLSPDGHGGVFRALLRSGLFEQLESQGVHTLFYFQVDNPLVKVADPVFLGHHLRAEADLSLKVVRKRDAQEKVGVYALVDERPGIIEYSDLSPEQRDAGDADGLKYWAGNIAIHAFQLSFLRQIATGECELPYHMARKKVPHVDERGERVQPSEPNGVKFESFVFDALPFARKVVAMEVERSEEFAPVKNREGEDSPATAVAAQSALFRSWLSDAGIPVADEKARIEVGPLFALDREELHRKIRKDGLLGARTVLLD